MGLNLNLYKKELISGKEIRRVFLNNVTDIHKLRQYSTADSKDISNLELKLNYKSCKNNYKPDSPEYLTELKKDQIIEELKVIEPTVVGKVRICGFDIDICAYTKESGYWAEDDYIDTKEVLYFLLDTKCDRIIKDILSFFEEEIFKYFVQETNSSIVNYVTKTLPKASAISEEIIKADMDLLSQPVSVLISEKKPSLRLQNVLYSSEDIEEYYNINNEEGVIYYGENNKVVDKSFCPNNALYQLKAVKNIYTYEHEDYFQFWVENK